MGFDTHFPFFGRVGILIIGFSCPIDVVFCIYAAVMFWDVSTWLLVFGNGDEEGMKGTDECPEGAGRDYHHFWNL